MEFKKKKEKILPILKYTVSDDSLEGCKERFVIGVKFCNKNIIPNCTEINKIIRTPSFYRDTNLDVIINLGGSRGSFTVWKNGVFADIIP